MIITLDIETLFSWIGTAVCIIAPSLIVLGLYANFGVYRKTDVDKKEDQKWK